MIEHAWLFDHYAPIQGDVSGPCLEGWITLAAYAARTTRLRLGLMVTGNTYRHPAVLAKIATTVDVISNGRLDFGIGAGWNEYEHTSMGYPALPAGRAYPATRRGLRDLQALCTQPTTDFDGRYYQLKEARCEPKPVQKPYPPIVIGGGGEQLTLKVDGEARRHLEFRRRHARDLAAQDRSAARALRHGRPRPGGDRDLGAGAGEL